MNSRERVLAHLDGKPVDRLPVMPITMQFACDLIAAKYHEKRLIDGLHALGTRVRLHICGNTRFALEGMGRLGCEVVDLDSLSPMAEARAKTGANQLLLGNINPVTVLRGGTPDGVRSAVAECHRHAGSRFIVGAGCEIPRDTPHANVHALTEYARGATVG